MEHIANTQRTTTEACGIINTRVISVHAVEQECECCRSSSSVQEDSRREVLRS